MAHMQKPDFVFRWNWRVHLNRRGESVQSTTGSRGVRISGSNGSNAGYNMFRGSVKSTGYPINSPVSRSLPLPCVTVCHHISIGLYYLFFYLFLYDIHVHYSVCVHVVLCWQVLYSSALWKVLDFLGTYVCMYTLQYVSAVQISHHQGVPDKQKECKDGKLLFTDDGWSGQKKHVVVY